MSSSRQVANIMEVGNVGLSLGMGDVALDRGAQSQQPPLTEPPRKRQTREESYSHPSQGRKRTKTGRCTLGYYECNVPCEDTTFAPENSIQAPTIQTDGAPSNLWCEIGASGVRPWDISARVDHLASNTPLPTNSVPHAPGTPLAQTVTAIPVAGQAHSGWDGRTPRSHWKNSFRGVLARHDGHPTHTGEASLSTRSIYYRDGQNAVDPALLLGGSVNLHRPHEAGASDAELRYSPRVQSIELHPSQAVEYRRMPFALQNADGRRGAPQRPSILPPLELPVCASEVPTAGESEHGHECLHLTHGPQAEANSSPYGKMGEASNTPMSAALMPYRSSEFVQLPLMEHQKQGLSWMNDTEESFQGGILADEMGLGKTIQALSLIALRGSHGVERHATLIITPAGLLEQWKREIGQTLNRGGEKYKVYVLHGANTKRHFRDLKSHDIVLTTYGTVSAELLRRDRLARTAAIATVPGNLPILGPGSKWHRVILDEAHHIKNEMSRTAMACCAIDSMYRWCLSGTPVMNNHCEIWSLLKFLRLKDRVGDPASLRRGDSTGDLPRLLESVILRRTKESTIEGRRIIQLLPKLIENVYVTFGEQEQRAYTALEGRSQLDMNEFLTGSRGKKSVSQMLGLLQRLRQACCHPFLVQSSNPPVRRPRKTDNQRRRNARQLHETIINRLKWNNQILDCPICWDGVENTIIFTCGHGVCEECFGRICPPLAEGEMSVRCPTCRASVEPSEATDYWSFVQCHAPAGTNELPLESLLNGITDPNLKSDSPFSGGVISAALLSERSMQTPLGPDEMRQWLREGGFVRLRRQVLANPAYREKYRQFLAENWMGSSKVDKVLEIVDRIKTHSEGEKIVIFSQFTSVLDLVEVPLMHRNYRRYDGSMKMKDRQSAIEDFMNVPDCTILLMSLRAGNAGLNLTAASHVIMFEPFWNPYIEDQAVGRVHRIGQHKQVRIYRILIPNTVEDRILRFQDKKRELTQQILKDKKSDSDSDLRRDDFAYLFGLSEAR